MTEGQSLLLLFVALYLLESLRWLPTRSSLLVGSGEHWRLRRPFHELEIGGGSPCLLGLLPPLENHCVFLPWPLVPTDRGIEVYMDERPPRLVLWEEVSPQVTGCRLQLVPGIGVRGFSDSQACQWQEQILRWKAQSQVEREADFFDHAQAAFNQEAVAKPLAQLSQDTRWLRWLGGAIFVWTFGVMALLYRWLGDGAEILWAAGALLLMQVVQAVLFYRKASHVPYRIWKALAAALLPQHAMRVADLLSDFHPTTAAHPLAARGLIDETAWKKLAKHFWKRACYSAGESTDLQCRVLEAFFKAQGVSIGDLEEIPSQSPGTASYCPNCHAQFQAGITECRDCGGVKVRAFETLKEP